MFCETGCLMTTRVGGGGGRVGGEAGGEGGYRRRVRPTEAARGPTLPSTNTHTHINICICT